MSIGIWQVVLVLLIVLLLFGAGKLPKVLGDLGKGIKSFKSGLADEAADGTKPGTGDASRASSDPALKKDEAARG